MCSNQVFYPWADKLMARHIFDFSSTRVAKLLGDERESYHLRWFHIV